MVGIEKAVKDYGCFLAKQSRDPINQYRKFRKYVNVVFSNGTVIKIGFESCNTKSFNTKSVCLFENDEFLDMYSENLNKNLVFDKGYSIHELLTRNILNFKKSQRAYPEFSDEIAKAYNVLLNTKFPSVNRENCLIHPLDLTYQTVYGTFHEPIPKRDILVLNHIDNGLNRVKKVYEGTKRIFNEISIEELCLNVVHFSHQENCTAQRIQDYVFPNIIAIITSDGKVTF